MKTPVMCSTSGDFQCLQLALIDSKGTIRIELNNPFLTRISRGITLNGVFCPPFIGYPLFQLGF